MMVDGPIKIKGSSSGKGVVGLAYLSRERFFPTENYKYP